MLEFIIKGCRVFVSYCSCFYTDLEKWAGQFILNPWNCCWQSSLMWYGWKCQNSQEHLQVIFKPSNSFYDSAHCLSFKFRLLHWQRRKFNQLLTVESSKTNKWVDLESLEKQKKITLPFHTWDRESKERCHLFGDSLPLVKLYMTVTKKVCLSMSGSCL